VELGLLPGSGPPVSREPWVVICDNRGGGVKPETKHRDAQSRRHEVDMLPLEHLRRYNASHTCNYLSVDYFHHWARLGANGVLFDNPPLVNLGTDSNYRAWRLQS
jgi:hypothetical protein